MTTKQKNRHADSTLTRATESTDSSSEASSESHDENHEVKSHRLLEIPYTILLPTLVVVDMIGVSLVVPLLHSQYFQLAGVNSAVQREWLASIFSASQILGGLVIGALSDSQVISRHSILITSFMGSAFAYAMIMEGGLLAIAISRVTVGLVKQTQTVATSIMAHTTHEKERATHVGRLNAATTIAWIVGPSLGAYLFSHVGTYAPIYASLVLFTINALLVFFCAPYEDHDYAKSPETTDKKDQNSFQRILSNFHACFRPENPCLTAAVLALLLFQWTSRTTSYKNIASFYEIRFGSEPYQREYLQSYQSFLMFVVQSTLVRPILHHAGGEINAACGASMLMALANFVTVKVSFLQYLMLVCPVNAIATAILGITLKSVVSKVAPKQSLSSVFATVDILQNAAQVTVPFYRTYLFTLTQPSYTNNEIMVSTGDPDPNQWLVASGIHWLIAAAAFSYLLLQGRPCAPMIIENDKRHEASSSKLKES